MICHIGIKMDNKAQGNSVNFLYTNIKGKPKDKAQLQVSRLVMVMILNANTPHGRFAF